MQHAEAVAVSDRGDEKIHRREPVMADSSELTLGVDGPPLDLLVDVQPREGQQLGE